MGDQARPRPTALDRQGWHRRLHDCLAGTAAQLRANMADYLEAGRHVFQHLALILPDPAEHGVATVRRKNPQGFRIGWQGFAGHGHGPILSKLDRGVQRFSCRSSGSAVQVHTATGLRGASGATVRRQSIASINRAS